MRMRATIIAALGLVLLGAADANGQCTRPGTVEDSRVRVGNVVHIYCVCARDQPELNASKQRIQELEEQIKKDREAIKHWQDDLPDLQRSLDEWVEMDEKARA